MKSISLFALWLTTVTVSSQAISNDECVSATVIRHQSLPFVDIVNTKLATNNPDDPITTCSYGNNDGNTFWYKYKASLDGLIKVATDAPLDDDKLFNSVIGVFSGPCVRRSEIICKDYDFHDTLWYPVTAEETYFIQVGAEYDYGDVPGILNFTLSFEPNYFAVVNADTDRNIGPLQDLFASKYFEPPGTIDYRYTTTSSLSIAAKFHSNTNATTAVRSVRFTLDQPRRNVCESSRPFTLFGDTNGNIAGAPLLIGSRMVTATPYTRSNCRGTAGKRLSQKFTVVGCEYVNYAVYDGRRDKYISSLYNASTVRSPPCQVNIGVEFVCGFIPGMVRLELRNAVNNRMVVSTRAETTAPYFLFGDNGQGNINVGSIPAGEYTITAIIDGIVHPAVRFTMGVCNPSPPAVVDQTFHIDLRLGLDNLLTYENSQLFATAVDRISSLVIGDRPDVSNTTGLPADAFCGKYPPIVDDLYICAGIFDYGPLGGILGFLLRPFARESDGLPFTGTILLDTTYFKNLLATGEADFFVQQQLIQVLGLGLSWKPFGLAERNPPCKYNGTKATAEFKAITGCSSIPLEQNNNLDFATEYFNCLFWDQKCLKEEILTLSLGKKKISRITLGALEDLGYVVNYTAADPYGVSDIGECAGCGRRINEQAVPPVSSSSCHHGSSYENAIIQGQKMLHKASRHYKNQDISNLPEGIVYTGDQEISVAYMHEDGTLCSTIVQM